MIWAMLGAWLAGWLLTVRPMLQRTMRKEVCAGCNGSWSCAHNEYQQERLGKVVRGTTFKRNGYDVAVASWNAAWWPMWLPLLLTWRLLVLTGRSFAAALIRATPLTKPELEAHIAAQAKEIDRLTEQIGRDQ